MERQDILTLVVGFVAPDGKKHCLQGCGNVIDIENDHNYCEYCCNDGEPHQFCELHGEGTEYWEQFHIDWYQVKMHQANYCPPQ